MPLSLRPVDLQADAALLHGWVVADGEPVGLVPAYDPPVDETGKFYERRPGDLGVHCFLCGSPSRAGRTAEIVAFVLSRLFRRPASAQVGVRARRTDREVARIAPTGRCGGGTGGAHRHRAHGEGRPDLVRGA